MRHEEFGLISLTRYWIGIPVYGNREAFCNFHGAGNGWRYAVEFTFSVLSAFGACWHSSFGGTGVLGF